MDIDDCPQARDRAVAHCNAIATAAEKLATENEKAADYYNLRAKELQGK